ncbi:DUF4231 domain-containing protein [Actinomadura sp. BRA 177]|uniref:DUF4231 domain-containing protein n=1 Tax=Actinomadura sp. BRA 177 TaxID=2745202 RepID=UPI001595E8B1|nr:DUF4231 domain-containing protein [Actinomadura sp. BRA 177]NVI93159.1 DUF4231 domain-containing protein [Actinomadura sp. BRA 177]
MTSVQGLSEDDFPQVFRAADTTAIEGRRQYMSQTSLRLVLTVAAAALGVKAVTIGSSRIDWAALAASVAFFVALALDAFLLHGKPERAWYEGRALAESAKTLTWKWAVGGNPYPKGGVMLDEVLLFVDDLKALRRSSRLEALAPIGGTTVTQAMRDLRESSLSERKEGYLKHRLEDQLAWYSGKSRKSKKRANMWRYILLALEILGGVTGLLKAGAVVNIPIDAVVATGMGAVGAWLEAQQHDQVGTAYAVAVADLSDARVRLEMAQDEESWAQAVNDAEDAISREHTRWRASRSQS